MSLQSLGIHIKDALTTKYPLQVEGQREPGRRKRPQCPRENLSFTPRKAIPASLPLSGYAGLYYHPGYQYLNVVVSDELQGAVLSATPVPQLHAEQPDTDFRFKCDFVHVPGENWIMYVDLMDAPTLTVHSFAAVEFRIGSDGEVASMGVEWRQRNGVDASIWYKRVCAGDASAPVKTN